MTDRILYQKTCAICGSPFETIYLRKEICGYDCKLERNRENARLQMRERRNKTRITPPCVGCGHWLTENHHEGHGNSYRLCPNCHSSITRGYYKLNDVLKGGATTSPF